MTEANGNWKKRIELKRMGKEAFAKHLRHLGYDAAVDKGVVMVRVPGKITGRFMKAIMSEAGKAGYVESLGYTMRLSDQKGLIDPSEDGMGTEAV